MIHTRRAKQCLVKVNDILGQICPQLIENQLFNNFLFRNKFGIHYSLFTYKITGPEFFLKKTVV